MTGQEFIASLSPVAHRIMSIYQFKEEKPIALHITDNVEKPCYMVRNDPTCYPLYINPEALGPMAEKMFMHQFCHCMQIEENFPFLISKTPEDPQTVELAEAINSLVLDMFVNHALRDNGYPMEVDELNRLNQELHFSFRYYTENDKPFVTEQSKYAEYLYATQIARIYFELESKPARTLQKEAAAFNPNIKIYSGMFINIIKAYPYDTHIGCHYIFERLLENLKLTDILEVDHREENDDTAKETAAEEENQTE